MKLKTIILSAALFNILPFTNIGHVYCMDVPVEQTTIASRNESKLNIIQDTLAEIIMIVGEDFRTVQGTVVNGVTKMFTGRTSLQHFIYDRDCRKLPIIASEIEDFYNNSLGQTYTEGHWVTFEKILDNLINHYRKNIEILNKTVTKSIEKRPEKTDDLHAIAKPVIEENTENKDTFELIKNDTRERLNRLS